MLLAYFDDSGEQGVFLLSAVVVEEDAWLNFLDAWTDYRRWLRDHFGLRMFRTAGGRKPVELHATEIATGWGQWKGLSVGLPGRLRAYRAGLRLIGRFAKVFAVAWLPDRPLTPSQEAITEGPAVDCWRVSLERLATYSSRSAGAQRVMTFADTGYEEQFRKVLRKMRRHHRVGSIYGGTLSANAPMLLDDPVVRDSKHSPFVQMADLCAYAALREIRPTARVNDLWPHIGQGILRQVNQRQRGQPPGIKLLPP